MQPDSIVPNPANPQSLNRYTYALNQPFCYVDPDGHFPLAISLILIAAGTAGIIDWGIQVRNNTKEGLNFWQAVDHSNIDEGRTLKTAATAGSVTALAVTAGPAVVSVAGQGLMGVGMATSSTAMWTAGTTTVATSASLYYNLWGEGLTNSAARQYYYDEVKSLDPNVPWTRENAELLSIQRNDLKIHTRNLMIDRVAAERLDITDPIQSFDYYVEKYTEQGYSGEALWGRIITGSMTPNPDVNRIYHVK